MVTETNVVIFFRWIKYLGPDLPPVENASKYNFKTVPVKINDTTPEMCGVSIFSDGSKTPQGTGAGWCIFNDTELVSRGCRKIPDHCSVFEAEIAAVLLALDDITSTCKYDMPEITFYIDNQAVLKSLNSYKIKSKTKRQLTEKVHTFIETNNCEVNFNWVRGHSGGHGNEMADEMAKNGCVSDEIFHIDPSLTFIKSKLRLRARKQWNNL